MDVYAQLVMQTEYLLNEKKEEEEEEDEKVKDKEEGEEGLVEKVDKDQLIKGFKYGIKENTCSSNWDYCVCVSIWLSKIE